MRPVLACLALLLAGCGADTPQQQESPAEAERAIRDCFAAYKSAVLDGDGEAAAAHVTASTIAYYERILELVLGASAEETKELPLVDRMSVLLVRAQIEPEKLRAMDGRKLFAHAVDIGMIGKNSVIRNELGDVVVSGTHATGEHAVAGQQSGVHFRFHRENGSWRMDITSILPAAGLALRKTMENLGMTENEFIFEVIAMFAGTRPTEDVWQPVGR